MTQRTDKNGLQVAAELVDFIEGAALPGTGIDAGTFWAGLSDLVHDLGPKNRALLQMRGGAACMTPITAPTLWVICRRARDTMRTVVHGLWRRPRRFWMTQPRLALAVTRM